jgi:AcrR family transcriptional regulator
MDNVKEKILNVSRELFLSQGFKKTTTRQILAKANIKNGSLYHFFKNKEDVFTHLALNTFDEGERVAEQLAKKDMSPVLKYAITLNMELYSVEKHDRLAELYYEAYSSWALFETLARKGAERNKLFFKSYNPEFTDQDYYIRTIAIKGCIYGFIAERYFKGEVSYQYKIETLLEMSLSLFNVPKSEIKIALKKSCDIVKKNKIVVSGFKI